MPLSTLPQWISQSAFGRMKPFSANIGISAYSLMQESIALFDKLSPVKQKKCAIQIQRLKDKLAEAKQAHKFSEWK